MLLIIFLLGLSIGSFLNVVVYRMLNGDSPWRGRSQCPSCKKQIKWYDNIPLLSYALLKGRCRFCRAKISLRYPVLELLTGCLFVWWYGIGQLFFRLTLKPYSLLQPAFWLLVGVGFVSLLVSDLFYGVLPDLFNLGLAGLAFAYRLVLTWAGIMQPKDFYLAILSGLVVMASFWLLIWLTHGKGMGAGDAKLALALGIILGWPKILVAMFVAFLTGAVVGIILILVGKKKFGQTIPFGPFMILGAVMALLGGEMIWGTYMTMLGV